MSDLLYRAKLLYSEETVKCKRFFVDVKSIVERVETMRNNPLWASVIVGNSDIDISALIENLNNSSWVAQGRQYIQVDQLFAHFARGILLLRNLEKN